MGNVIPTPPCWGECKPMSRKRRALSQLYQAMGVAPGTVDAVSDIIPFGQKPSCIPAKGVGPKAQTWAWPAQIRARSCAGNPTLWVFRKNANTWCANLPLCGFLESAQSLACALIYIFGITFYGSGAENYSFLGVRGNSDAQNGEPCS